MFELNGKVAIVTGGKQGMGKAEAIMLAKQGAKVAVADINLAECQLVVDEIEKNGGEGLAIKMDVSNAKEVDAGITAIVKKFGRLDILVNNAGVYIPKPALELTEAEWDKTIDINLKGEFLCAQRAAKEMAKNKYGRIINIASIASGQVGVGIAGGVHYTASKGGIIGMTETLAIEFAPLGINVNAIGPGAIQTPMADPKNMPKGMLEGLVAKLPIKRMGQPNEIANAVVFLASEEASYVTGATLFVDGGWLAS